MIKLITICTCSLSSQYGKSSVYLYCQDKEIDQSSIYVFSFFLINQRTLFWYIVYILEEQQNTIHDRKIKT